MAKKPDFIFTFQNSCSTVDVSTFTPSSVGGKQAFTVTGYTLSDYLDEGDEIIFVYSGETYTYTIFDITGNQITTTLDYNAGITNVNTVLKFAVKTEANPYNFHAGQFQWERDKDNYFMRLRYSGTILFKKDDYDYLYEAINGECCAVLLKIYKLCDNEYSVYYRSQISWIAGVWNESYCTFESDIPAKDKYDCVLANANVDRNLLELYDIVGRVAVVYWQDDRRDYASFFMPFYEYLIRAVAPVAPGNPFTPASGANYVEIAGTSGYVNDPNTGNPWSLYVRHVYVATYHGDALTFVTPTIAGLTFTSEQRIDGKIIARYTAELTDPDDWPIGIDVIWGTGGDCEYRQQRQFAAYDPINDNCVSAILPHPDFSAYYSVGLGDSLKMLTSVCSNISIVTSDFFQINPIGDTPGYVTDINYVTGFNNYVRRINFGQITNVTVNNINPGEDALEMLYSFGDMMRDLNIAFNVYWFIDSSNRLRIEHDSWFINNLITNVSGFDYNKKLKTYTYIKEEVPNREKFTFENQLNVDFVGTDIVYGDPCSDKPVVLTRNSRLTTDVHYVRNHSDQIGGNGIMMFAGDTNDALMYEPGILTGISLQNNHLSWANLHYNYHTYGRILENGLMNYVDTVFQTWKKRKKQNNQKYLGCCLTIPETLGQVTTELGTGNAVKITYDINTGTYLFELEI